MTRTSPKKPRPALDDEGLERLALFYAGRYATTRAKLRAYLARKLGERGWSGSGTAPVERLVERFAELGYVDDRAFASSKAAALLRRGYGARRVGEALRAAGIEASDAEPVREEAREGAWEAALRFARRKRIGPFAAGSPDREARQKAMAAMLRAGHDMDHVRRILNALPGEIPDLDDI
ncbi:RecX family transcriptional regulator [Sphingomonas parva]|uniref:Regulatory protein RecX n=1 Tax=Sphingomonas parva TaxID=2555898 RepID=A0A4Y8ZTS4_9SPHN|nr:regulatory protein RecX [Sphingomonas parva]TFI58535.1 RecX family transcriptional regulator [Sphingomonas parva]